MNRWLKMVIGLLLLLSLWLLSLAGCATAPGSAPGDDAEGRAAGPGHAFTPEKHFAPIIGKPLTYVHVVPEPGVKAGTVLTPGRSIGRPEPWPDKLSKRNDAAIRQAMKLYDTRQYQRAHEVLARLREEEENNPFVLYMFAMTTFWATDPDIRALSLSAFEELERITTEPFQDGRDTRFVVDLWFRDLYWKLGCLYLDRGRYDDAILNITKAMAAGFDESSPTYEQQLSFLTEAYCFAGDRELNEYFYQETLRLFPGNTYVETFRLSR